MTPTELEGSISLLQRANVLFAYHDGPVGRPMIADRADCSRSTAYRATSELQEQGLLERTADGYRLTGAGEAMLDHIRDFTRKHEGTVQLLPLFEYVKDLEIARRAHLFTNAEIVTQDASSPYQIENRVKAIIDDTQEQMLGMTTGLGSPALADAMIDRIRAGVKVDWILPTEMYDQFNDEYGELVAHAEDSGQTVVFVWDQIPIDLALYDETLVVIGFDHDKGVIGVIAITDNQSAVRWGRDLFDECRSTAEQVE